MFVNNPKPFSLSITPTHFPSFIFNLLFSFYLWYFEGIHVFDSGIQDFNAMYLWDNMLHNVSVVLIKSMYCNYEGQNYCSQKSRWKSKTNQEGNNSSRLLFQYWKEINKNEKWKDVIIQNPNQYNYEISYLRLHTHRLTKIYNGDDGVGPLAPYVAW